MPTIPIGSRVCLCDDAQAICESTVGWNDDLADVSLLELRFAGRAKSEVHGDLAVVSRGGTTWVVPMQAVFTVGEPAPEPTFEPGDLVMVAKYSIDNCINVYRGRNDDGECVIDVLRRSDHLKVGTWEVQASELTSTKMVFHQLETTVESYGELGGKPEAYHDVHVSIVLTSREIDMYAVAEYIRERHYSGALCAHKGWLLVHWVDKTYLLDCRGE